MDGLVLHILKHDNFTLERHSLSKSFLCISLRSIRPVLHGFDLFQLAVVLFIDYAKPVAGRTPKSAI